MARAARFALLTFIISWALWSAASAIAPAYAAVLFLPGTIAPALVALFLTRHERGDAAVRELLARAVHWRVSLWFYLLALSYMAAVKLAAAALQWLWTGAWPAFGGPIPLMLAAALLSTPVQAGEEIGWRGYMLPHLADRIGFGPASLVLGVIWSLWHVPMFHIAGGDMVGQSFLLFTLTVTPLTVVFAWLYVRTGSLLLPMLMHAAVNNMTGIVPSRVTSEGGRVLGLEASYVALFTVGLLWIAAGVFLASIWRIRRNPSPAPAAWE